MVQNFNDDDSSNLFWSRTTLNSISHKLGLEWFYIGICLAPSLIKTHRKVFFYISILCSTPYSWTDFQYLIHQVASCYFQCNWILVQLLNWIEVEFNSIQVKCNIIQYFCFNGNLFSQFFFFHQLINWLSLIVHNNRGLIIKFVKQYNISNHSR
jgi:hypothetical protein